jgi:hypothetical protein
MITHNEETGWGFTLGKQPYVGYASREEAATALYDLERGIICRATDAALAGNTTDDEIAILDWIDKQAAALPGNVIVTAAARYDTNDDAVTPTIRPTPAGLAIGYDSDEGGPAAITEVWHASSAPLTIVLTDDNELWVLSRDEWGSPAQIVTVERLADAECPCTDYRCGNVTLEVLDDRHDDPAGAGLTVYNFGGDCRSLASAEQDARDLLTLLGDERVKAAIDARMSA